MIKNAAWRGRVRAPGLAVLFGLAVGLAACSGSTTAPLSVAPTDAPLATDEPLATEAPAETTAATKKPTKTPKATTKPANGFYKPSGWDGSSDLDCPDFDTHAHAQSFFKGTGGTTSNDPYRLDANHDGVACESLP